MTLDDTYFMKQALIEAGKAAERGEVPVGAVVVCKERIIARAHNLTETLNDVTAHAEMPLDSPCQNSLATASGTIFVLLGLTLPARRSTTLMYGISPILISCLLYTSPSPRDCS
mgnify:CR=1 FL=1